VANKKPPAFGAGGYILSQYSYIPIRDVIVIQPTC
jgi:hypothetical protein